MLGWIVACNPFVHDGTDSDTLYHYGEINMEDRTGENGS